MSENHAVTAVVSEEEVHLPARRAVRIVLRTQLDILLVASERLGRGEQDALHDFRVALRRFRTWLHAYSPYLRDTIPKKIERELDRINRSTNAVRDLEVQHTWLTTVTHQHAHRPGNKRRTRLIRGHRQRYHRSARKVSRAAEHGIRHISQRLESALTHYHADVGIDGSAIDPTMRAATTRILRETAAVLRDRLARVRSSKDLADMHHARIAAKRLRYLLEPFRSMHPSVQHTIDQLTMVQDTMGELRDVALMHTWMDANASRSALDPLVHRLRRRTRIAQHKYDALCAVLAEQNDISIAPFDATE